MGASRPPPPPYRKACAGICARRASPRLREFTLASGRRVDVMALSPSGQLWIVEIKSSLEDFRADLKWPEYRDFCDRLYFAITTELHA